MGENRPRFLYIFQTKFSNARTQSQLESWKNHFQAIHNVKWEKIFTSFPTFDETTLPSAAENFEQLSDHLHSVLDSLPSNGPHEYLLDILWLTDSVPSAKKMPPPLFGALKRAVIWHGASVLVMSNKLDLKSNPAYLDELRAEIVSFDSEHIQEFLDADLCWRGTMAFFDDNAMSYVHMGTFELSSSQADCPTDNFPRNALISQRLKVVTKCAISTIPPYFLTNSKYILRTSLLSDDDETSEEFFNDDKMFAKGNCVIAKLERHETKNQSSFQIKKSNQRTSETWKKSVLEGTFEREIDQDLNGKSLQSTFFAIFDDPVLSNGRHDERNCIEKRCILLNPDAPLASQAKSFEVVLDSRTHKAPINDFGAPLEIMENFPDFDALQDFVGNAVQQVVKEMKSRNPDKVFDESQLEKDAFAIISNYLRGQIHTSSVTTLPDPKGCQDCQALPFDKQEAFPNVDSENKRFLSFVQHCKRNNEKKANDSNDEMMTPSGDFVVLEAKEMLKHFNKDGLPKMEKNLTILKPPVRKHISEKVNETELKKDLKWPDALLTEYHDVYYNRTENSEKNDATNAKIQQMYVGSRETASTCHILNSKQTVVHTMKSNAISKDPPASINVPNLRRTPRKVNKSQGKTTHVEAKTRKPSKDPQEIFKQKLRGAVYDALSDLNVTQNDPLFKPCFKKLFDICNVYAKDMPKNTKSTKQWLAVVAKQNATTVINLEKALRN